MKFQTRSIALCLALVASPACSQDQEQSYADAVVELSASFPDSAWRTVDPENLLIIDTAYGEIGVELFPEIAPNHVAQVKTLARDGFYNNVPFHRVIDDFMNQTGDGENGNGTGDSDLPNLEAEFTFRRGADMPVTLVSARGDENQQIGVGFYKSLPIASQPISQAILTQDGKVGAFGLHCSGVTSMARSNDPNSANSQFFLMRGTAEHLDAQYSIWGQTVMGREYLESFKVGTIGEDPGFVPDQMNRVQLAADLPEEDRPTVQVLRTDGPVFADWVANQTYEDICDIEVPTRVQG